MLNRIMNAIIQGQLDRVEVALNTLVSSIESYNPSVPAAIDLLAADTELQKGVKQCNAHLSPLPCPSRKALILNVVAQHQAHYARILSLRSAIEAHEQQRKSTLSLLASTRKDLLSTPATTFPETSRDVPYTELLDYASRISRYTIPPTFREPPPPTKPADPANAIDNVTPLVNGASDAVTEAREVNAIANGEVPQRGNEKGIGVSSLEQQEVNWLNPMAQIPFTPWPTEDVIKRGALGQIQVMLEQGVDPVSGDPTKEGASVEERQEENNERMQIDVGKSEAPAEMGGTRIDGGERKVEARKREDKPKVFKGLDLDEDSEEDDD
ncbi:MAG: hypothetical protein L6R41_000959 [Letrouitia leprolyta]|nr:MAG: hypothetical protein L6R41_000959 [Letrouitia leprolyta]